MESPNLTQHWAWELLEFIVNDIPSVNQWLKVGAGYLASLPFLVLRLSKVVYRDEYSK